MDMKVSHILLATAIFTFLLSASSHHNFDTIKSADVDIHILTEKRIPDGYIQNSEGAIIAKLHGPIRQMSDFNQEELEEIKKTAKKYNGCVVYVDIHRLYKFNLKTNELYYFWLTRKWKMCCDNSLKHTNFFFE